MRKRYKEFFETFPEAGRFASAKARELRRVVDVKRVGAGFDVIWWQDYVGAYDPIREADGRVRSRRAWPRRGASPSGGSSMKSGEAWKQAMVGRLQAIQACWEARRARSQG